MFEFYFTKWGENYLICKAQQNCADLAQQCGSLRETQSTPILISVLPHILESAKIDKIYYLI